MPVVKFLGKEMTRTLAITCETRMPFMTSEDKNKLLELLHKSIAMPNEPINIYLLLTNICKLLYYMSTHSREEAVQFQKIIEVILDEDIITNQLLKCIKLIGQPGKQTMILLELVATIKDPNSILLTNPELDVTIDDAIQQCLAAIIAKDQYDFRDTEIFRHNKFCLYLSKQQIDKAISVIISQFKQTYTHGHDLAIRNFFVFLVNAISNFCDEDKLNFMCNNFELFIFVCAHNLQSIKSILPTIDALNLATIASCLAREFTSVKTDNYKFHLLDAASEIQSKYIYHSTPMLAQENPAVIFDITKNLLQILIAIQNDHSVDDDFILVHTYIFKESLTNSCLYLIDYCDTKTTDDLGFTLLHYAAKLEHVKIFEKLFLRGSTCQAICHNGHTVIDLAITHLNINIINVMLANGVFIPACKLEFALAGVMKSIACDYKLKDNNSPSTAIKLISIISSMSGWNNFELIVDDECLWNNIDYSTTTMVDLLLAINAPIYTVLDRLQHNNNVLLNFRPILYELMRCVFDNSYYRQISTINCNKITVMQMLLSSEMCMDMLLPWVSNMKPIVQSMLETIQIKLSHNQLNFMEDSAQNGRLKFLIFMFKCSRTCDSWMPWIKNDTKIQLGEFIKLVVQDFRFAEKNFVQHIKELLDYLYLFKVPCLETELFREMLQILNNKLKYSRNAAILDNIDLPAYGVVISAPKMAHTIT